ncbi:hypothetical protein CP532_4537 [Ophiocordyceps camponoti-leonardi (nom. inval.)]|nr:hypothetical protein CP532_4537 [Ophiocordyceps camponoti-leonardi (nom. inval.)]
MTALALIVLALYTHTILASSFGHSSQPVVVKTPAGTVAGRSDGSVDQFLGLRFGAPPVRFNPPQPASGWEGTYDASHYRSACIQKFSYPEDARERAMRWFNTPPPPGEEGEDCLFLNVYAPAGAEPGSKAVMFWIYGGGFSFGSGSISQYDGTSFARDQDVVIVTINYRTNVFGFPGSPEKPKSEQNLGLLDQRLALDWVRNNIRHFGGNPDLVTIFGESAGSGSVEILVTNPPEPVPYAAAIMSSGVGSVSLPSTASARSWQKLIRAAKCDTQNALDCIRALPAKELKDIVEHEQLTFFPIYDGVTWTGTGRIDRLESTSKDSVISRVPLLIGSNADDGGVFVYGLTDARTVVGKLLPKRLADQVDKYINTYASFGIIARVLGRFNPLLSTFVTEYSFQCPSKLVAEESVKVGIPAWRYFYDAGFANSAIDYKGSGAAHSSEISIVFGTYSRNDSTPFQVELSKGMQKMWADFAKNPHRGPGWAQAPLLSHLGAGVRAGGRQGEGEPIMRVVKPGRIDARCRLFTPIYNAAMRTLARN